MTVIKSSRVITVNKQVEVADHSSVEAQAREIIQKAEFASEEILEKAYIDAKAALENALEQGRKVISEERSQMHAEAREYKETAYKEGYKTGYEEGLLNGRDEGFSQAQSECEKVLLDAESVRSDIYERRNRLSHDLEMDIVEMVQIIFEKIVRKLTAEDNDLILSLVKKGISQLDLANKLIVITCKSDYDLLTEKKDEILAYANFVDELDLKYDHNMQRGDCIIETSKGNIDVSLSKQLGELRFFLLEMLNREE